MHNRRLWIPLTALVLAALACGVGGDTGPNVLYKDDFSNPDSGWGTGTDDTSSLEYENGEYVFKIYDTNWLIWGTADESGLANVHIEVKVMNTGDAADPTFGIVCDYQDDANFYYMGIGSDGYYAIAKYENDDLTIMSDSGGQWVFSDKITENADSYTVGADCAQGKLTLFVDGTQIDSVEDSAFDSGEVGLFTRSFDQTEVEVHFDDFVVTEIP